MCRTLLQPFCLSVHTQELVCDSEPVYTLAADITRLQEPLRLVGTMPKRAIPAKTVSVQYVWWRPHHDEGCKEVLTPLGLT